MKYKRKERGIVSSKGSLNALKRFSEGESLKNAWSNYKKLGEYL